MAETPEQPTHAERVKRSRKKPSLKLPADSPYDWPLNFNELVEWYTNEVMDLTRAAQMRIKEASAFVQDCANRKISLEEARQRWSEYDQKWGDAFPHAVIETRNKSDEEINERIKAHKAKREAESRSRG